MAVGVLRGNALERLRLEGEQQRLLAEQARLREAEQRAEAERHEAARTAEIAGRAAEERRLAEAAAREREAAAERQAAMRALAERFEGSVKRVVDTVSATAAQVARIYINNGSGVFTDQSASRGAVLDAD